MPPSRLERSSAQRDYNDRPCHPDRSSWQRAITRAKARGIGVKGTHSAMSNYYTVNSSATERHGGNTRPVITIVAIVDGGVKHVPGGVFQMLGMNRSQTAAICIAIGLLMVVAAGCGASKPVIKSVKPNKGLVRTGFKISGTFFGKTRDKSTVTVGGKKSNVISWSDTSITATVPTALHAGSYPVIVTTGGRPSNKVTFTVFATFTGSTPLPAMLEFLKNRKVDTKGMTFTAVATSKADPTWKLDKAAKTGGPTYYFLFRKTSDGWTIIDFGSGFTADQMRIDGAPGDLKPPT